MPVSFSFTVSSTQGFGSASSSIAAAGAEAGAAAGRDFRLDADGDLSLEEGDFVLIAGAEAVASDLRARLQTFAGEWFLDTSIGVPYFSDVFGKTPAPRVEAVFREQILGTPGVASIESIRLQRVDRRLLVAFRVLTDFGELIDATLEV
jgi:hypothetical protein